MSSYNFANMLQINDPRSVKLGMIAIDVDQDHGFTGTIPDKISYDSKVTDSCMLFPLGLRENVEHKDKGLLFMMSWLNGFSYGCQLSGVIDMKDVHPEVSSWVNLKGVCSSGQIFTAKSPATLNSLFSCFKPYNSKTTFSHGELVDDSKISMFVKSGGIAAEWASEPLHTRYVIRSQQEKHGLDYLYLISGSLALMDHEHLSDRLESFGNSLISCHKTISENPKEYATFKKEIDDYKVWYAFKSTSLSEMKNKEAKANFITECKRKRTCIRLMIGVSYIYNYLMYAKNVLGESKFEVLKLDGQDMKVVSVDSVLDSYEPIYRYFRNLAFLTNLT